MVLNSEGAADIAAAAVAAGQIVGFDGFFVAGFHVDDSCDNLVGALLEGFELGEIADFNLRQGRGMVAQDRIEVGLGNPQPSFGTIRRTRLGRAVGRMIEAGDLEAVHARDEQIIARVVGRIARLETHTVGEAPAAQMLAGARVGEIGRRKIHRTVALLDHQAANATVGKLDGKRQPDRAGAGDENGYAFVCRWVLGS